MTWKEYFNIPNTLCYLRILLIPVFMVRYLTAGTAEDYVQAAAVLLLSGLTDCLDGLIARRYHMVTEWGKMIDPIADKLTQGAVAVSLMLRVDGMGYLFLLLVVKELFMGINGLILLRRGKKLDGARWFGKVSTAVFYTVTFLMVAFPLMGRGLAVTLMVISGAFLTLSLALYFPMYVRMYRSLRRQGEDGEDKTE